MNHKAKDVADEWNLSSVTIVCRDDDENLSRLTDATMAPSNGDLRLKDGGGPFFFLSIFIWTIFVESLNIRR